MPFRYRKFVCCKVRLCGIVANGPSGPEAMLQAPWREKTKQVRAAAVNFRVCRVRLTNCRQVAALGRMLSNLSAI